MLMLIKYDMIELSKKLLPIWIVVSVLTIAQSMAIYFEDNEALTALLSIVAVFIPAAIFISLVVLSALWFGKSMFSDRAYLTFTLPRSNYEIVISKILTTLLFTLFAIVLTFLLMLIPYKVMISGGTFMKEMRLIVNLEVVKSSLTYMFLLQAVSAFSLICLIYFSIAVSNLASNYKTLYAIIVFILMRIITKTILGRIISNFAGLTDMQQVNQTELLMNLNRIASDVTGFLQKQLLVTFMFTIVVVAIYTWVMERIVTKKLNL